MTASGFFTKVAENNCKEESFSQQSFSQKFLKNYFLVLAAAFRSFCFSLNMSEAYLEPS